MAASLNLRSLVPSGTGLQEVDRNQLVDVDAARSRLIASLNQGHRIVNYTGHGSVDLWRANLFTSEDALGLTNGDRLSFFVLMTCLNGYAHDARLDSLAESLLKAKSGGAVAVWASSGMTVPDTQDTVNQELFRAIFGNSSLTLGEATRRAKEGIADNDVRQTWILFGDPTTRLR
jgi:hypothetical protein